MTNTKSIAAKVLLVLLVGLAFLAFAAATAHTAQLRAEQRASIIPASLDTTDEATDVLVLDYDAGVPEQLWAAALDAGYRGDPNDSCECLYVPVGTVLDVPGGLALATMDGWMGCQDFVTSSEECAAAGPVEPISRSWAAGVIGGGDASWTEQDPAVAAAAAQLASVEEDSPAWRCAVNGNHVCGPGNSEGAAAGCYSGGVLVQPWTRYDVPQLDPLWAQLTPPC